MMKKAKFLIFCMIFVANAAFSQRISVFQKQKLLLSYTTKPLNKGFTWQTISLSSVNTSTNTKPELPISAGFYASNLGFFCRQEIKFEKTTKIPFKFRLGSVQQCDWMEGKPNTALLRQ